MFKLRLSHYVNQSLRKFGKPQSFLAAISTSPVVETEGELAQAYKVVNQAARKIHFPSYTLEQQQAILDIVNNDDTKEILNYDIAKTRAAKLTAWKKRNGPMKNVEDILLIEGFSLKLAEKFYKSMLEENIQVGGATRSARQRTASFITPVIDAEHRSEIRSSVSLRIGVSSVTWTRLVLPTLDSSNVPCCLTHWEHHEITEKKLHLGDLIQRLWYINHLIPDADCYIFENPQMAQMSSNPGSVDQQNINIQKCQVIAVLAYALFARGRRAEATKDGHESIDEVDKKSVVQRPNVFYIRRFLAARLFSQLVGTERVSTEETILNLMRIHYNVDDLFEGEVESGQQTTNTAEQRLSLRGNVQFPLTHREMFSRAGRYQREFLGQSFLLNLAFVRLVLLQDENSIAAVTRNQNKGEAERTS
ncbi:uncharacterized protein LOC128860587 [Anastrepha ludens]|uniref:uncharacterized protein LOC128860587 n=1 Tax=Anastrepha ludens TaxID=28586 RepID=UPI0023B0A9F8|nr:uncharacterized protein LOC128860587 [Anastrepha ludens]